MEDRPLIRVKQIGQARDIRWELIRYRLRIWEPARYLECPWYEDPGRRKSECPPILEFLGTGGQCLSELHQRLSFAPSTKREWEISSMWDNAEFGPLTHANMPEGVWTPEIWEAVHRGLKTKIAAVEELAMYGALPQFEAAWGTE